MKKPLVSIIIVNWNGGEVFDKCLHSLSKLDYPNWELIVVDNGSTDNSEKLVKQIKRSVLIQNKKNIGFAEANNQGWRKSDGDYLLLLNNDTKVKPDLLKILVSKMKAEPDIGVVQPKIKIWDKPDYLDNAGSFITRTGLLQHWGFMEKDSKEYDTEKEIFSAKGACMLVRKSVVESVGLFDSNFVSYMEESDFCWRVWLAGYRVVYYPKTYILHKVGMTSKRLSQVSVNFHSNKNRIFTLFKNLSVLNLLIVLIPHIAFIFALGLYYLLSFRPDLSVTFFKAIFWNLRNLPILVRSRIKVQRIRNVSDKVIFDRVGRDVNVGEMINHFRKVDRNLNENKKTYS